MKEKLCSVKNKQQMTGVWAASLHQGTAAVCACSAQQIPKDTTCVSLENLWLGDFWLTEKEELGITTYTRVLQTLPTRLGFRNISTYGNHSVPRRHLQDTPTLILSDPFQSIFTSSLPNALLPESTALRAIKWKEDTSVFHGLGSANYCNGSMEPPVTEHILRAAWGQGIPPHSRYRKLRAPFPLNAPPAVCKSKDFLPFSIFFLLVLKRFHYLEGKQRGPGIKEGWQNGNWGAPPNRLAGCPMGADT